jgi:hypothetical protein
MRLMLKRLHHVLDESSLSNSIRTMDVNIGPAFEKSGENLDIFNSMSPLGLILCISLCLELPISLLD